MNPHGIIVLLATPLTAGLFLVQVLVLFLLLACSALISGAEVAFFGLGSTEIKEIEEQDSPRGRLILQLLGRPKKLLATILIANNAVNIGIVLLYSRMGEFLHVSPDWVLGGALSLNIVIDIAVATVLILLFGEILPKVYANRNRLAFSHLMSIPIWVLDWLFSPVTLPLRRSMIFIQDRLGKRPTQFGVDHLSQALELTSEGDTTHEEMKLLEGIVTFGNTDTKQVMRPRIDIFALEESMPFSQVLKEIVEKGYSRVPVYSDSIDQIKGVLYVKDLLPYIDHKDFDWVSLVHEPYFVPENKKLDDLLLEFQAQKKHLAVVVDEYGGTSGIVTLEDVIEEIVGDISDEFDDEEIHYSKLDDHNYVFEGKTNLKDFYRVAGLEESEALFEQHKGESETIAGFVLELSKGFPRRGEPIVFESFQFVVEALDRKRLKQIKVTLPHEKK